MNIDAALRSWSEADVAALGRWRQGHLIHANKSPWVDLPLSPVPLDSVSISTSSSYAGESNVSSDEVRIMVDPGAEGAIPYVVIISQSCDVVGEGPGARHPFVQVAPVRDVSDWSDERIKELRRGELNDYLYLTAPPHADVSWALDLRVSWPVAKEILIERKPIDGFASFADEREIGVHLALKYQRPALPDVLSKTLPDAIRALVKAGLKGSDWADEILQVRLEILSGTELEPKDVRLIVVSDVPLTPAQKGPLKNVWSSFKKRLRKDEIEWATPSFRTLDNLSARAYRGSILMNIPELHSGSVNRS